MIPGYLRILLSLGVSVTATAGAWSAVTVEKTAHAGWDNCYRLANGTIEAIVTSDVGPRVIWLGFPGGPNLFHQVAGEVGKTGGSQWRLFGGHRLSHAPEARPRSYQPDNDPIDIRREGERVRCIQPVQERTGIQKEIAVAMDPAGPTLRVVHRLTNRGLWPIRLAPRAVTVMEAGGIAVLPLPTAPSGERERPNRRIVLWPDTHMTDPRLRWEENHLLVFQDYQAGSAAKIGLEAPDGWGAYFNGGQLFVKRFAVTPEAAYPDKGCSLEVETAAEFLQLETLGPLAVLEPGQTVEHVETWHLFRGVRFEPGPEAVERAILPRVRSAIGSRR